MPAGWPRPSSFFFHFHFQARSGSGSGSGSGAESESAVAAVDPGTCASPVGTSIPASSNASRHMPGSESDAAGTARDAEVDCAVAAAQQPMTSASSRVQRLRMSRPFVMFDTVWHDASQRSAAAPRHGPTFFLDPADRG